MALKTVVGNKIVQDVIRGCSDTGKPKEINDRPFFIPWKVLVVDHTTVRIISSCCKMHEIALEGILLVENIDKRRQRFTKLEAIYLLSPTEDSVNALIKDFEDPSKPAYGKIHVFFTEVCPDPLFNKLGNSACASRIETLKEIEFAFLPYESQVFTLDSPSMFKFYYTDPALSSGSLQMGKMAEQIATLCATLGEYPFVRYSVFGNVENNSRLAELVQRNLDIYKENHVQTMGQATEQARSQLIILDRSFDCVTPLLHELTFQAMAYDLLDIENDIYKPKGADGRVEKEITLDESNELWSELRHKNIGVASQRISSEIKAFQANKKGLGAVDATNLTDLTKMIKQVPQYQKDLKKYNTNFRLAEDCIKQNERIRLLCKIEQDLAVGTNEQGESIKDYMSVLNPVLLDSYAGVTQYDKLRVIMLYILNQNGISEEKFDKLLQHGNIETCRSIIMNLEKMSINVINNVRNQSRITQIPRIHKLDETFNVFARWTPTVKEIMDDIIADKLDRRNFPFLEGRVPSQGMKGPAVSARYGHWHLDKNQQSAKEVPRLIVFIVGGVTFSEMRSAYEVSEAGKNWEVVIGSTHVMTPNSFLKQLKEL